MYEATRLALGYLFKIHHRNGSPGSLRTKLTLSTARTLATHRVTNAHVLQSHVCNAHVLQSHVWNTHVLQSQACLR